MSVWTAHELAAAVASLLSSSSLVHTSIIPNASPSDQRVSLSVKGLQAFRYSDFEKVARAVKHSHAIVHILYHQKEGYCTVSFARIGHPVNCHDRQVTLTRDLAEVQLPSERPRLYSGPKTEDARLQMGVLDAVCGRLIGINTPIDRVGYSLDDTGHLIRPSVVSVAPVTCVDMSVLYGVFMAGAGRVSDVVLGSDGVLVVRLDDGPEDAVLERAWARLADRNVFFRLFAV